MRFHYISTRIVTRKMVDHNKCCQGYEIVGNLTTFNKTINCKYSLKVHQKLDIQLTLVDIFFLKYLRVIIYFNTKFWTQIFTTVLDIIIGKQTIYMLINFWIDIKDSVYTEIYYFVMQKKNKENENSYLL